MQKIERPNLSITILKGQILQNEKSSNLQRKITERNYE
jgi:hypothetical protein